MTIKNLMPTRTSNQFLELTLEQIPRLLGQLNRNPSSKSYGSFDRAYWHYRTNDISCARYQEAVYTLALLYCSDFENNIYYRDDKILQWIKASLRFTASIQHYNGSFDEWYINEGSYVATAFVATTYCELITLFKRYQIECDEISLTIKMLEKAANFLIKNQETVVMNQVSGAIFAIGAIGQICHNKEYILFSEKLANDFVSNQNTEGWWYEYGGPDIGYLTLTISYLEKYRKIGNNRKISDSIDKAKSFVEKFINPDQTAGGEYMSRNTEYIIPSKVLPYLSSVGPAELDDRYLCYILYNWLETGLAITPQVVKIPIGQEYFTSSGLLRVVNNSYFLVVNGKKGGSFKLYGAEGVYYDSGLEIKYCGYNLSTGILDKVNHVKWEHPIFQTTGYAKKIKEPLLDTKKTLIFKSWQFVFGQISFLQKFVKKLLRQNMISYSNNTQISFKRVIEFSEKSIIITDILNGKIKKDDVLFGLKASYNAVPSSKYMISPKSNRDNIVPIVEYRLGDNNYIIKRTFLFN